MKNVSCTKFVSKITKAKKLSNKQLKNNTEKYNALYEYVRVCSAHGAGFFYIPGSDTCIKIGGRVRFDYGLGQTYNRQSNVTGMGALGRFELDARNSTEYGLLRAYTRVDFQRNTGGASVTSGSGGRVGTLFGGSGNGFASTSGNVQTAVNISRAFVQLGGMTAGRSVSFFSFYAGDYEMVGTTAGDGRTTQLLAYTATFGSGFSGTLSVEDTVERRNAIAWAGNNTVTIITGAGTGTGGTYYNYGGAAMPDIVANLRVDQGWGSAQLSGAIHQTRIAGGSTSAAAGSNGTANSVTGTPGYGGDQSYGWALNAGVKFNLPMIAAGDALFLQATYTQGASSYIANNALGIGSGLSTAVGKLTMMVPDAVITGTQANPSISQVTVWGLTAAGLHYWTPTVRQALFASYVASDIPAAAFTAAGGRTVVTNNLRNANYWTVGSNVIWSPIKGLDIGAEVNYLQINSNQGALNANVTKNQTIGALVSEGSAIVTRLRIDRNF